MSQEPITRRLSVCCWLYDDGREGTTTSRTTSLPSGSFREYRMNSSRTTRTTSRRTGRSRVYPSGRSRTRRRQRTRRIASGSLRASAPEIPRISEGAGHAATWRGPERLRSERRRGARCAMRRDIRARARARVVPILRAGDRDINPGYGIDSVSYCEILTETLNLISYYPRISGGREGATEAIRAFLSISFARFGRRDSIVLALSSSSRISRCSLASSVSHARDTLTPAGDPSPPVSGC